MSLYLDFAKRGRNAPWRYGLATVLALALSALVFVAIYLSLLAAGVLPATLLDDLVKPTHPVVFFIATGVEFGAVLIGFVLAIRWVHGKRFADVIGAWRWRLVGIGAGAWALVQVVGLLADTLMAPGSLRPSASAETAALALSAAAGLAVQTFAEEFVFRGYVTQGLLLATRRPWAAAVLSGLLFGALHWANGPLQALNAVIFGAAAAILAIRTGGIALTFGLHFVNNLFGAVIVVSSSDVFRGSPGLFTQTAPQLMGVDLAIAAAALVGLLIATRNLGRQDRRT